MLFRSSSTPILNSWLPHYTRDYSSSSPEPDHAYKLTRAKSVSLTPPLRFQTLYDHDHASISQASSPNSAKKQLIFMQKRSSKQSKNIVQESKEEHRLFSSSGLGELKTARDEEDCVMAQESEPQTLAVGGEAGKNGGNIRGGGGCKESNGGGGDGSYERNNVDAYYQRMIEANPGNGLLLGNYAKYLKEVKGDMDRAEVFCGMAILVNPRDGNILSLYADLIWNLHKDASRAESYYDQALKSAPGDCYVLASYAKFLWEVENDDDDKVDEKAQQKTSIPYHAWPSKLYQEAYHDHRPNITAAS